MYCPNCGTRQDDNAGVCDSCGYDFTQRDSSSQPTPEVTPAASPAATVEDATGHPAPGGIHAVFAPSVREGDQPAVAASAQPASEVVQSAPAIDAPEGDSHKGGKGKVLAALGSLLVIIVLLVGRTALRQVTADANSEQVIRSGIEQQVEEIHSDIEGAIADATASNEAEKEQFTESTGLDFNEFVKAVLEDFDITVDDIQVNGNSGTVWLTVRHKDLTDFDEQLDEKVDIAVESGSVGSNTAEEDLTVWYGESIMQLIAEAPVVDTKFETTVTKKDSLWSFDESEMADVAEKMIWGTSSADTTSS